MPAERVEGVRGMELELTSEPCGHRKWKVLGLILGGELAAGELVWYLHRIELEVELEHQHRVELHMVTEGSISGTNGEITTWWRTCPSLIRHQLDAHDLEVTTRTCEQIVAAHWPHPLRPARLDLPAMPQGRLF